MQPCSQWATNNIINISQSHNSTHPYSIHNDPFYTTGNCISIIIRRCQFNCIFINFQFKMPHYACLVLVVAQCRYVQQTFPQFSVFKHSSASAIFHRICVFVCVCWMLLSHTTQLLCTQVRCAWQSQLRTKATRQKRNASRISVYSMHIWHHRTTRSHS